MRQLRRSHQDLPVILPELARNLETRILCPCLQDLQTAGQHGPAAALNNGLTDTENRSLSVFANKPYSRNAARRAFTQSPTAS